VPGLSECNRQGQSNVSDANDADLHRGQSR
jgi:hypothetical protein